MKQIPNPAPEEWAKAVCLTDPDAWHADEKATQKDAREACRKYCPLRDACLRDALAAEKVASHCYGVRGGLYAHERAKLLKGTP